MAVNLKLLTAQIVGMFVVIGLALFLAAGTVAWQAGWVFLLLFFGFTLALSRWLLRHNPGLLTERLTGVGKADQQTWDKVFFVIANVIFLAWLIVMPLDAVRFHWSEMPSVLQIVGGLLLIGSFYLFFLIFRENAYLSPAVRIQSEREHAVVSTGPYRYVRIQCMPRPSCFWAAQHFYSARGMALWSRHCWLLRLRFGRCRKNARFKRNCRAMRRIWCR